MSTQLRLVEHLPPASGTGNASRPRSGKPARKPRAVARSRRSAPTKPVNWGDWRLDARTRTVGRAGVAAARRALEQAAAAEQLSEAS